MQRMPPHKKTSLYQDHTFSASVASAISKPHHASPSDCKHVCASVLLGCYMSALLIWPKTGICKARPASSTSAHACSRYCCAMRTAAIHLQACPTCKPVTASHPPACAPSKPLHHMFWSPCHSSVTTHCRHQTTQVSLSTCSLLAMPSTNLPMICMT